MNTCNISFVGKHLTSVHTDLYTFSNGNGTNSLRYSTNMDTQRYSAV